jgi:hypothetical protein
LPSKTEFVKAHLSKSLPDCSIVRTISDLAIVPKGTLVPSQNAHYRFGHW